MRLRSTSDTTVFFGFLNTALARADTRQQAVEILISQQDGTITRLVESIAFNKRLDIVVNKNFVGAAETAADVEDQGSLGGS